MAAQFFVQGEKILLKSNGVWLADGIEITHEQTRDLFFRSVHWKKPGFEGPDSYYLSVGYETIAVEVEDTAFFVTSIDCAGDEWKATLSDGEERPLDPRAIRYRSWSLYLDLGLALGKTLGGKVNPGYPWAKFLSAPYYEILSRLEEDESAYYIAVPGPLKKIVLLEKETYCHCK